MLRDLFDDCGAEAGDTSGPGLAGWLGGFGFDWQSVGDVVHQVGGAVLSAYGGGALVKPMGEWEQRIGMIHKPPPPTPATTSTPGKSVPAGSKDSTPATPAKSGAPRGGKAGKVSPAILGLGAAAAFFLLRRRAPAHRRR